MTSTRRRWTLVGVALATFMTFLDNNVVNVALPSIQRDLHLSISGLEWIVSSYILVFSGLMLVGGRLADVYGRRRLFVGGLAVFTVASLMAGLATSPEILITARVLQGLGAAASIPSTLAIVSSTFPDPKERSRAVGVWSAVAALAAVAFGIVERRDADRMVDMSLFGSRTFSGGTGAMILWGFGVMGVYFFTAMYLQNILGFSPTEAGAAFVPMALMMVAIAPVAGLLARRVGTHVTVALGLTLNAAGLGMVSFVGEHGRFLDLMPAFVAFGVGSGLTMIARNGAIVG